MVNFDENFQQISIHFESIQEQFGERSPQELAKEISDLSSKALALSFEVEHIPDKNIRIELLRQQINEFSQILTESAEQENTSSLNMAGSRKRKAEEPEETTTRNKRKAEEEIKSSKRQQVSLFEEIPVVENPQELFLRPTENDELKLFKTQEYQESSSMRDRIEELIKKGYSRKLAVRGDGNCYYRAVYVSLLQEGLKEGRASPILKNIVSKLEYLNPPKEFLHILRSAQTEGKWLGGQDLIAHLSRNRHFDLQMIQLIRTYLSTFTEMHKNDEIKKSGLTTQQYADAIGINLKSYRKETIEKMGQEAEEFIIPLLADAFGIKITVASITPKDFTIQTYGSGNNEVHVLFRQGHYDILYK